MTQIEFAQESPKNLPKKQILTLRVWGGAQDDAFLTSSQEIAALLLLVQGPRERKLLEVTLALEI